MSEKKIIFAENYDEPTALAFTDFTKPSPILEGEDAERFLKNMEEVERKAEERAKKPMTKEDAKRILPLKKVILDHEMANIKKMEKEIEELENFINTPD